MDSYRHYCGYPDLRFLGLEETLLRYSGIQLSGFGVLSKAGRDREIAPTEEARDRELVPTESGYRSTPKSKAGRDQEIAPTEADLL